MFCCTLLYVHSCIAIILMGKRELVALLNLSSWYLVMVERLFLEVPWVVCSLWLWYFPIILTIFQVRLNKCIIFKKKQKYQTNSAFTKFHLTNIKGLCADRCSSFAISLLRKCLCHARRYHKARFNSRENYYCFNDTDFLFGPIYPNFTLLC